MSTVLLTVLQEILTFELFLNYIYFVHLYYWKKNIDMKCFLSLSALSLLSIPNWHI